MTEPETCGTCDCYVGVCPESTPEEREAYEQWAEPMTVKQAAIMKRGIMFTMPRPFRHGHIIWAMSTVISGPDSGDELQGFVLSDGTFATRRQAMQVAYAAAQLFGEARAIYRRTGIPPATTAVLYTEDLW